jgi:rhodanese-related sulfurtransferase
MVTRGFKKLLAEANAVIETVSVPEAMALFDDGGVVFVDVRETNEREQTGTVARSVHAPRGFLEFIADPQSPIHNPALSSGKKLIVFCASGGRSTLAVKSLLDMGVTNVVNMAGGYQAWCEAGGAQEP